jgi:hypothetical protein
MKKEEALEKHIFESFEALIKESLSNLRSFSKLRRLSLSNRLFKVAEKSIKSKKTNSK